MRPFVRVVFTSLSVTLAGGWLVAAPFQAAQNPQQQPIFRAGTNLVTVDAYPLKDGKIVEGLTADDFSVSEDSKPQKIEAIEFVRVEPSPVDAVKDPNTVDESMRLAADPHNRVFVAFLDTHHVHVGGWYYANRPLIDTLNKVLAPNDLFGVMTPAMRPQDVTLGRKTDTVEAELTKDRAWGRRESVKIIPEGDLRRYCYLSPQHPGDSLGGDYQSIRDVPLEIVERSWEEQSLQALEDLSTYLGRAREARSAVLIMSAGWKQFEPNEPLATQIASDSAASGERMPGVMVRPGQLGIPGSGAGTPGAPTQGSVACAGELIRLARLDNRRRIRDLVAVANRNNVSFYAVNPEGLTVFDTIDPTLNYNVITDTASIASRTDSLMTMAENTNGIAIVNTNDIAAGLKRVVDAVSVYYLIGYYSTNTKIDGTFRRIDVKVARPNVKVAARRGYTANRNINGAKPALSASGAAEGAFGALAKIQPDAELYTAGVVLSDALSVVVEIPSKVSTAWSAGGDVTVTATTAAGEKLPPATGKIEAGARGTTVRVPIASTTAGQWRVQIAVKGSPGALEDSLDLKAAPGSLLGDAQVFRGAPSARSAVRPVADMQFYRTERVHIEWPELKTLDQRQARLLGRNGQPLAVAVNLTEREQDGHQVLAADVILGPLAPADYVIELTAGAAGASETKTVGIRIK